METFSQQLKPLLLIACLLFVIYRYFGKLEHSNREFLLSQNTLKYHANWIKSIDHLEDLGELRKGLLNQNIEQIDISFAMSSSLGWEDISQIFPLPLRVYKKISLNFGNVPLSNKGAAYILSLIQNGVEDLELYLDSVKLDNNFGKVLGQKLSNLTTLKNLKLSMILCGMGAEGFQDYFGQHKIGQNMTDLQLIFIGNSLKPESMTNIQQYLANTHLSAFSLNLYANGIGVEGGQQLGKALSHLNQEGQLKTLQIDLYFNNITEVGTKALTDSIVEMKSLQKLYLNLDFNYIKNQGGKELGHMFKNMKKLRDLDLGVASKNFGYLGFKSLVDGLKNQTDLERLSLRCGVNRVGINGAEIVNSMLLQMPKLTHLTIGFVENYIGDDGLASISQTIANNLPYIQHLVLDLSFNDAKGYGGIAALRHLSKRSFNFLNLRLSNNQFRDYDIKLMKPFLKQLIKNTHEFRFDFMETAVSRFMMAELKDLFRIHNMGGAELSINSVIPEQEQKKAEQESVHKNHQNEGL